VSFAMAQNRVIPAISTNAGDFPCILEHMPLDGKLLSKTQTIGGEIGVC
jgi:hypothetical protein